MGDREYRPWIIEQIFSGKRFWTLYCKDETGAQRHIQISKSIHNGIVLEKMLNIPVSEWAGTCCGYTAIGMNIEAIICVWAKPEEIRDQTEFRGFRINGKYYFFASYYSVFLEERE